jgi:hypothetical protein
MDVYTHELDLRYALAAPPATDRGAHELAFGVLVAGLSSSITALGLPALAVRSDGVEVVAGVGVPEAAVRAGRLDLYRSLAGRRSVGQIARLTWTADPRPWLPAFSWGPFVPPASPVEADSAGAR